MVDRGRSMFDLARVEAALITNSANRLYDGGVEREDVLRRLWPRGSFREGQMVASLSFVRDLGAPCYLPSAPIGASPRPCALKRSLQRSAKAFSTDTDMIVALEGIDGAGKSTQAAKLCDALSARGLASRVVKIALFASPAYTYTRAHCASSSCTTSCFSASCCPAW